MLERLKYLVSREKHKPGFYLSATIFKRRLWDTPLTHVGAQVLPQSDADGASLPWG